MVECGLSPVTYNELQQRIATRLNRPDLLLPVAPALTAVIPDLVQDRILYYQKALYAPSEVLDYSITTIPSQSIYFLSTGMQALFRVRLLLVNIWIPLTRVDFYSDILMADVLSPPFITLPSYWATYGQTIRLYPTPNLPYPIEIMGNASPPAPVNPNDDDFWTEEAATLIIEAACADICRLVLNDEERANRHQLAVGREQHSLLEWSQRLRGPTQIRPWL